jgi:hypothetical protein
MNEYSPRRRTALVLTGSGASGAYLAGALKALDETGTRIDLLVGTGAGAVAAAFGAVAGGPRLYGPGGFWDGLGRRQLCRLRPLLRAALGLLGLSLASLLLPLVLAVVAGLAFPLVLLADLVRPGLLAAAMGGLLALPARLRAPYLAAVGVPLLLLALGLVVTLASRFLKDRRRFAESLESVVDDLPGALRLRRSLWEVARASAVSGAAPGDAELGQRYVSLLSDNLGQPGFRELVLRLADVETGDVLPFAVLADGPRARFARPRSGAEPPWVDLRREAAAGVLPGALRASLFPPLLTSPVRVRFAREGPFPGETHRLADGLLAAGSGIAEALAAGAEQVVVVSPCPEAAAPTPRRRGLQAALSAVAATRERQALEADLGHYQMLGRVVLTVGHPMDEGGRAWEDPATGTQHRSFGLWVVRPDGRNVWPLDWNGAREPATEVWERPADLMERGYRDAYRLFVEPVLGAVPDAAPSPAPARSETQPVEL